MGRSIRSKRGKELRRIQRDKMEFWDHKRIGKLSASLTKPNNNQENVSYTDEDGNTHELSDQKKEELAEVLEEKAKEMEIVEDESTGETSKAALNKIIKSGTPKRKKRKVVYNKRRGKNDKKSKNRNIR